MQFAGSNVSRTEDYIVGKDMGDGWETKRRGTRTGTVRVLLSGYELVNDISHPFFTGVLLGDYKLPQSTRPISRAIFQRAVSCMDATQQN